MEVKKGYKQTEVGVIPNDWEVKEIGAFASVSSGGTPNRKNPAYWTGKIPWITTSQIDFNVITEANEFITEDGINNSAAKIYKAGTLLVAMYGQGKTRGKVAVLGLDASTNQACAAISLQNGLQEYVFHNLSGRYKELRNLSNTGNQENLSGALIKKFLVPFPPSKSEQSAIATVLSETDSLITKLGKLIAKKEAIKKGTIQALLSGKKRLPGFNEKWKKKKLSEIGKPYGGLSGKSKKDFDNGKQAYIPFMNVMSNAIIDTDYFDYVTISPSENQNKVLKGDLLFNGSSETPEEVGMCSVLLKDVPNLYLNSFCFGFRLNKELNASGLFLSYFFRSNLGRKLFFSSAQGATRYNLSKNNFLKIEIPFPEPEEQEALGDIIRDLENEIWHLNDKAEKCRSIKQGMMQNLLTGKIRLL
jgi:type I restriction enzyme S subunit